MKIDTQRIVIGLAAVCLLGCKNEPEATIVPFRLAVVEMSERGDSLAHDVAIMLPLGFSHHDRWKVHHSWDGEEWTRVSLAYDGGGDDPVQRMFEQARNPCREGGAFQVPAIRRETFPDGFQVLCGLQKSDEIEPAYVVRYIRVDLALLQCEVSGLRDVSAASVRNAWNICATVRVARPHIDSEFYPEGAWTMELTTFPDGWTGWRSKELRMPASGPSERRRKYYNTETNLWDYE